jgi:hypothetical protein
MSTDLEAFQELSFYTLAHGRASFIHQLAVDAFAAQHASESSKPISVVFSLLGLYLHLEHGFSGKQVQRAHMQLARVQRQWQPMPLPAERGTITVHKVLAEAPGPARDAMIEKWCASVWAACAPCRAAIVKLAHRELDVAPARAPAAVRR